MTEQRAPGELVSRAATVDARKAITIEERITIHRPAAELYAIWHTFEQLPDYIDELDSVTTLDRGRSDMRIIIDYEPPGGTLGALLDVFSRVFGQAPEFKIRADLLRFKRKVEAVAPAG
jgi:uncharacterized membrane protein